MKLHDALMRTANLSHHDAATRLAARDDAENVIDAAQRGSFLAELSARWSPTVHITWPTGKDTHGFDFIVRAMDRDLTAGVRHRIANVVAGRDVTIWEADLINPPHDPFHCPPGVAWALFSDEGQVSRVRLFHPRPKGELRPAV